VKGVAENTVLVPLCISFGDEGGWRMPIYDPTGHSCLGAAVLCIHPFDSRQPGDCAVSHIMEMVRKRK